MAGVLIVLVAVARVDAEESSASDPLPPKVADASNEARDAMSAIRVPDDWSIELWAAEPDCANVVALDVDHLGRVYVCETFRQNRGVTDNRAHDRAWVLADLSAYTVQDRIDYHKRLLGEAAITYAQHDDRIRRLSDTDGDGKADESLVIANGFNRLEEGTGAGVLAVGKDVYYTCIPKLWKLVDSDGDGITDERVVLSDGYGVRVAFRGHDMHGLIRGYDGRLYFSIGDRGYNVRTADGRVLADPVSGAVFRCELDGSGLEVFATGLRNPQELAFNDQGDWFSVDNNSDSGDKARIVHLLRDGDSGWRMYYQYLADRGPFNRERTWEPANSDQPASIVPPVANFTDGPSGLAYYPGTGFGGQLKDTFLICDFRGGASNSGIRSFRVQPKGATYELVFDDQPIWTCLATDVAFGPDGALYVSDWVDGWDGLGKARVYRIHHPEHGDSEIVRDVQSLLSGDWSTYAVEQLQAGLSHVDRRVRLESQWELALRGESSVLMATLGDVKAGTTPRLHALWGLGQAARTGTGGEGVKESIEIVLGDNDPVLRSAAAVIIGERGWVTSAKQLRDLLTNESPRVRYHAADALGRLEDAKSFGALVSLLDGVDADDPAIRHSVSTALSRVAEADTLASLVDHESPTVRLAAVVALGKQRSAAVTKFLKDSNSAVVLQAARTIHDLPLNFAMSDLAAAIKTRIDSLPLARRILNANFRVGTETTAAALAEFATRSDANETARIEALRMLADWSKPDPIDRVLGDYRPLEARDPAIAAAALEPQIDLLMTASEPVRLEAIETASLLGITKIAGVLAQQVADADQSEATRANALTAMARLRPASAAKLAASFPRETRGAIGLAAMNVLAKHALESQVDRFVGATTNGDLTIRQRAWDVLAAVKTAPAQQAIENAVAAYLDGSLDPKVRLNVVEAAQGRLAPVLADQLRTKQSDVATADALGKWLDSLQGGDPQRGSDLFFGKTELSCVRCHKVDRAGGEVGPNLTLIGKDRDARYLLEAICLPDATIAKGYETAVIADLDGNVLTGIVKTENDEFIELIMADGSQKQIAQQDIELRKKGKSSMPADLTKHLSPRELRDLVAYLGSLKVDPRAASDVE
ncbi:MAG: PVC-type heme-binding CxxCH protein [Planctomycetota bacterium]